MWAASEALPSLFHPAKGLEDPITVNAADEVPEERVEAVRPGGPALPQLGERLIRLLPPAQRGQAAREEIVAQGGLRALRHRVRRAPRRLLVLALQEVRDREKMQPGERLRVVRAQAQPAPQGLD